MPNVADPLLMRVAHLQHAVNNGGATRQRLGGTFSSSGTTAPSLPNHTHNEWFIITCAVLKPGIPFSMMKAVMPLSPSCGSVLAYTIRVLALGPLVIQNLLPEQARQRGTPAVGEQGSGGEGH